MRRSIAVAFTLCALLTVPWVATAASTRSTRQVLCFGDPSYFRDGWNSDDTSNGWFRQGDPTVLAQRVTYDNTRRVMRSFGCHTVKAEIEPLDHDANGGTANQRAQIAMKPLPALRITEGSTAWYGDAFATNRGFVPHQDPLYGAFNELQCFHNSPVNGKLAPQAPIFLGIATIAPPAGRHMWFAATHLVKLREPHLWIGVYGGNQDSAAWPNEDGTFTARGYLLKTRFVPGRRYAVQFRITWSAHMNGAVEVWINGRRQLSAKHVSNMWRSGETVDDRMFPVFGNYRAYDTSLPTNAIYYGGLLVGATRKEVTAP